MATMVGIRNYISQFASSPNINLQHKRPSLQLKWRKRMLPLSVSTHQQPNLEYLKREFACEGVKFDEVEGNYIARMKMQNGTRAKLMLPSGLITSYKPHMWHGGNVEILHTIVTENDGVANIQGGFSPILLIEKEDGSTVSPSLWSLQSISGSPEDCIEVDLQSNDTEMDIRYKIQLKEDLLSSEIVVQNSTQTLKVKGSLITHLTLSSPEATFALGLEGADFKDSPLVTSNFAIVPPGFGKDGTFDEMEGEEDDNYKNLGDQMSRIYTTAPSFFTILDRGRRNSLTVGREGADELYIFSPGSRFESYGMHSFICVGQSALLKPIVLKPGKTLRIAQHLQNPNV